MSYTYKYPRTALTVDIILIAGPIVNPMLLLIQRKNEPYKGKWAFPGGFLDMNETLKQAAERELEEETGVKGIELKQFHVFDAIDRDPRERTISTVHYGFSDDILPVRGGDDAQDAEWFQINNLPELAFDHREIIHKFIEKHLKQ